MDSPFPNLLAKGTEGAYSNSSQNMPKDDMKHYLTLWKLPEEISEHYHQKGIDQLFPWQVECLYLPGVLESRRNLVFSAPTSAGKSLVADILLFKTVLQRQKKAIVILPFVSITIEKVQSLKQLCRRIGIKIDSFAGSSNPHGGLDGVDVAVCTIEKANNMINRLIEENRLSEIGIIVVDELHMIGDPNRGFLLELLLSKLLYINKSDNQPDLNGLNSQCSSEHIQIVGMSATLPNLSSIAQWLDAQLYVTNYRPVPLFQKIVRENEVFQVKEDDHTLEHCNTIELSSLCIKQEDAPLIYSSIETVVEGYSALIFCATKVACEKTSRSIAENIYEFGAGRKKLNNARIDQIGQKLKGCFDQNKLQTLMDNLKQTAFGIDKTLESVTRFGVAFHHAGLSVEERSLIENAFREGTIRILCSTTTLSAGVNLPARRVLISSPCDYKGSPLDPTSYQQMIGRAGRKGIDQLGESMLFCKEKDYERAVKSLVHASLAPIKSCLLSYKNVQSTAAAGGTSTQIEMSNSLKRAILEVIANGTATHFADLARYLQCTFFHASNTTSASSCPNLSNAIEQVFHYLITDQLIYQDKDQSKLIISPLGKAIVSSGIAPDEGQFILKELDKARRTLSLITDLHLIYQVTPTYVAEQLDPIDWDHYFAIWGKLNADDLYVAGLVGVEEGYILARRMSPFLGKSVTAAQREKFLIHKRFYASLALNDLAQEMPLLQVATKYRLLKGLIQSLQQQSAAFAGMLTTFCVKLGWHSMELLIEQFQVRLSFGVQRDLIDLMRISFLNSTLARQLFQKDFDSLLAIIYRKATDIEEALIATGPFEKQTNSGNLISYGETATASNRIDPASAKLFIPNLDQYVTIRKLAELILAEARYIVEKDVGQKLAFGEASISQVSTLPVVSHTSSLVKPVLDKPTAISSKTKSFSSKGDILQTSTPKYSRLESTCKANNNEDAASSSDDISLDLTELLSKDEQNGNNDNNNNRRFTVIKDAKNVKKDETEFSFDDCLNDISWRKFLDRQKQSECVVHSPTEISRADETGNGLDDSNDAELVSLVENGQSAFNKPSKKSRINVSGSPILFDSDDSLMAYEPFISDRPNLKRQLSMDSIQDLSDLLLDESTLPVKLNFSTENIDDTSTSKTVENVEDLSSFFQTFREGRLKESVLPTSFEPSLTTKIPIDQYQLVQVKTEAQCQHLLEEIFCENVLANPDAVLNIAVHFRLNSIENTNFKNNANNKKKRAAASSNVVSERGFIIEDRYPMELRELNFARLGHPRVFQLNSVDMFECLQMKLAPWLAKLDVCFEVHDIALSSASSIISSSSSDGPSKRRFRFLTYDLKKTLYMFQFGFHLPISALMHRIDWHDLSVAIWLLDPETKQFNIDNMSVQDLVQMTLHFKLLEHQSFFQSVQKVALPGQVTTTKKRKQNKNEPLFNSKDSLLKTAVLFHLMGQFCHKLSLEKLYMAYMLIELPARLCLYLLQIQGVRIDQKRLAVEQTRLSRYMENLETRIYETVGYTFNLNSPKEVANVLYDRLDLMSYFDVKKSAKTSKASPLSSVKRRQTRSTSKLALMRLQEACGSSTNLPTLLMDWRRVNHAFNHSVVAIRKALSLDQFGERSTDTGDRCAVIYCQCEEWSATGRISMHEPNLINVDKDFKVITISAAMAQQLDQLATGDSQGSPSSLLSSTPTIIQLRKIICARDLYVLVSADYSQLELRILAHFTKDPILLATLNDPSGDVFISIAASWKEIPPEQVTNEMRQQAKQICYGIIYGMGNKSLATSLEVTEEEAAEFRKSFLTRYAKIEPFTNRVVNDCTINSYVETISHRRRFIPNISSGDNALHSKGQRQSVNTMIQGSAADMIKLSMVAVDQAIRKSGIDASLVMQMHDELMYEVRDDPQVGGGAMAFARLLKHQMEQVSSHLDVILPVKVRTGPSWGTLQDIQL